MKDTWIGREEYYGRVLLRAQPIAGLSRARGRSSGESSVRRGGGRLYEGPGAGYPEPRLYLWRGVTYLGQGTGRGPEADLCRAASMTDSYT